MKTPNTILRDNEVHDAFGVEGFFVHGDDEHPHPGPADADILDQFEAIGVLERQVDDDQVRRFGEDGFQGFSAILRFTGNDQVGLIIDDFGQALTDQRVVIYQQDSGASAGGGRLFLVCAS